MIERLKPIIRDLHKYLDMPGWKSKYVDYHKPFVSRVYLDLDDGLRLSLHIIEPCKPEEALYHPHPWPAAFYMFNGYETGIGFSKTLEEPTTTHKVSLPSDHFYQMLSRDMWHYVAPEKVSLSVMLSGTPWDREMPLAPDKPQRELSDRTKEEVLAAFSMARTLQKIEGVAKKELTLGDKVRVRPWAWEQYCLLIPPVRDRDIPCGEIVEIKPALDGTRFAVDGCWWYWTEDKLEVIND